MMEISRLLQPIKVPSSSLANFTSNSSMCCLRTRLMPACHSSHGGREKNYDEREITVLSSEPTLKKSSVVGGLSLHRPLHKRDIVGKTFCSVGLYTYPGSTVESSSQTAEEKIGVLLLNLGGPDTLHDVQPFLFNLFADPDIIRLPRLFRFLQRPLAQLISVLRAPKSKEGYAAIGGGSPLRKITDEQASALKMALETKEVLANVYVAMRYWHPFTEEAVHQIKRDGITKLVVLPLYPQYSISTTGSSVRALQNIFKDDSSLSRLPVAVIESWYQRQGYIKSMANLIEQELHNFTKPEEVMIFFSAHGVPVSYVENAGDPYRDQMEECIFLIMKELKARGTNNDHTLAYQSRVGPVQWLKPYTDEVLVELGQKGVKSLLAVPVRVTTCVGLSMDCHASLTWVHFVENYFKSTMVSLARPDLLEKVTGSYVARTLPNVNGFVSEHIETLEEIDMEYRELALESGIENWGRVPALNCTSSFITDLADAVIEALPSTMAMSTSAEEEVDNDPMQYFMKMLFGSLLAFVFLFSPKMVSAFKKNIL